MRGGGGWEGGGGVRGLHMVKSQEGADVILQICEGGVASRTIDLCRVHIPLELPPLHR